MQTSVTLITLLAVVVSGIVLLLFVFGWLYQKTRPTLHDDELGEMRFYNGFWVGQWLKHGWPVEVCFQGRKNTALSSEQRQLWHRCRGELNSILASVQSKATTDFFETAEGWSAKELSEALQFGPGTVRELRLRVQHDPTQVFTALRLVRLSIEDAAFVLEWSVAWDSEHTRSARLSHALELQGYGLTVEM
jgi:hypothetical protein